MLFSNHSLCLASGLQCCVSGPCLLQSTELMGIPAAALLVHFSNKNCTSLNISWQNTPVSKAHITCILRVSVFLVSVPFSSLVEGSG